MVGSLFDFLIKQINTRFCGLFPDGRFSSSELFFKFRFTSLIVLNGFIESFHRILLHLGNSGFRVLRIFHFCERGDDLIDASFNAVAETVDVFDNDFDLLFAVFNPFFDQRDGGFAFSKLLSTEGLDFFFDRWSGILGTCQSEA